MDFVSKLETTINKKFNTAITENFALGYRTTGKALLDLNFAVSSLRSKSNKEIINRFMKAYFEDRQTSIVWLFFARDARGGLGERRLFREVMTHLAMRPDFPLAKLLPLISEYGRFDDFIPLIETQFVNDVLALLKTQLDSDTQAASEGLPISIMAKWLPSINASSKSARKSARIIAKSLGMTWEMYRKTLSKLRKHLDIVERRMSAGEFDLVNYEAVPSQANIKYYRAFLNRDKERRQAYLDSLKKGKTKINANVLFPHDIVHRYKERHGRGSSKRLFYCGFKDDNVHGA